MRSYIKYYLKNAQKCDIFIRMIVGSYPFDKLEWDLLSDEL